jgi:hypothetical protein
MSTHRTHRVNRHTAERLLRGEPVEDQTGLDPLADLLAAAAAPSHDGDLAGEQAAVSAFRAAHPGPVTQPGRPSVLSTLLSKILTAKIAAAAMTVAAVGGVAVAATTGVLPPAHGGAPAGVPATSSQSPRTPAPQESPGTPGTTPETAKNDDAGNGHQASAPAPAPSLVGLCHAYLASTASNPGKALDSPAFGALIKAAGGANNVRSYCDDMPAKHEGHPNGAGPVQRIDPDRRPSTAPEPAASDEAAEHAATPPTRRPSPAPQPPAPQPPAPQPPAAEQAIEHAPPAPPGR